MGKLEQVWESQVSEYQFENMDGAAKKQSWAGCSHILNSLSQHYKYRDESLQKLTTVIDLWRLEKM